MKLNELTTKDLPNISPSMRGTLRRACRKAGIPTMVGRNTKRWRSDEKLLKSLRRKGL